MVEIKVPGLALSMYTCSITVNQFSIYSMNALITKTVLGGRPEIVGSVMYQLKDPTTDEDIKDTSYFGGISPTFSQVRGVPLITINN